MAKKSSITALYHKNVSGLKKNVLMFKKNNEPVRV